MAAVDWPLRDHQRVSLEGNSASQIPTHARMATQYPCKRIPVRRFPRAPEGRRNIRGRDSASQILMRPKVPARDSGREPRREGRRSMRAARSAAYAFAKWLFCRAAAFLWISPFRAARSSNLTAARRSSALAEGAFAFFNAVRNAERWARLRAVAARVLRIFFFADSMFGIVRKASGARSRMSSCRISLTL